MAGARARWFEGREALALLAALALLTLWRLAALALEAPPLFFDESQYWWWAQDPDWGYYSKPPLIAWGIAASTALLGDGMLAVRLPTLLCYPAAAWLAFLAARRLFDARVALVAALAWATLPAVSFYSWAATTDAWLILCWSLGVLALVRALEQDRWRDWLLLGAAIGFGLLAKYAMAVFAASVAAYLALHARPRLAGPKAWAAAALALALLAPNLWWNAQHDFQTVRHTAGISKLGGDLFHFASLAEFVASQFAVFGPILMGSLVVLLWRRRAGGGLARGALVSLGHARGLANSLDEGTSRSPPPAPSSAAHHVNDPIGLLLWLGLPMLALIVAQSFLARAYANWAQAAYLPLALAVVAWLVARERWGLLKASFAIHLAFAALVYHHGAALRALEVEPPARLDLTLRLRAWPSAGEQAVALLAARPGAALVSDEREVLAQMAYYARAAAPELAAFNPSGEVSDHFRLTRDLARSGATRFLIVSRRLALDDLAPRFERVARLEPIRVAVRRDRTVELEVFEAEGFRGYR